MYYNICKFPFTTNEPAAYVVFLQMRISAKIKRLVRQMAKKEGVTEQLKSDDWLCWLQKMNSIRSRAEEVVLHDLMISHFFRPVNPLF